MERSGVESGFKLTTLPLGAVYSIKELSNGLFVNGDVLHHTLCDRVWLRQCGCRPLQSTSPFAAVYSFR